ncbi:Hypothetical protein POVR1_LOCUS169 [uncultured virus]|nr:Hypothetical protein POVR1_LOCUS169 [uncultured virus]
MKLNQLKNFVMDPMTPEIGLAFFQSPNFWRLRAEIDYGVMSDPRDIANWHAKPANLIPVGGN